MEPIERIKMIVNKGITREFCPDRMISFDMQCVDSSNALNEMEKWFPELSREVVLNCIGNHLKIINGQWTDFLGGQTDISRELSSLLNRSNT